MSGETENRPSGWSVDTLKHHFDDLRQADKDALAIALTSADKANEKAEAAQRVVNQSQNEFRGTLKDQAATLMPRSESESVFKELRTQMDDLKNRVGKIENIKQGANESRAGVYAAIVVAVAIISLVVAIANGAFK